MDLDTAAINDYFRPDITIGRGEAEIRMAVDPKFFHAAGAVHGSVYFKAMDDAAFFAATSIVEDVLMLTTSFNTHLVRRVSEGVLIAEGHVVSATRRLVVADAELTDDRNRLLGRGTGSFTRSRKKLRGIPGYAG
jgi:uncharacterized protein (TIGR00369 family)